MSDTGFTGENPDETPNENYTVAGVTSDAPTPESERGPDERVEQPGEEETDVRHREGRR